MTNRLPSNAPESKPEIERSAAAAVAGALSRVFRNSSPERTLRLAAALGRSYARIGLPRVREARLNLQLAFPDLPQGEREALLIESFANLGQSLAEIALLQGPHRDALFEKVELEGEEHVDAILKSGTGAIVATAHFGAWELCGAAFAARGYPVTSVYRPREDTALDKLVASWRSESGMEIVATGTTAGVGVVRALKRGRFVVMLLDQNARRDEGVFVPFFGELASTRSGPAQLAMKLGVPVLPVFFHRLAGGNHVARVGAPLKLELQPQGDDDAVADAVKRNLARINGAIETAIRRDPAQWMWAHRRFRTRPPGSEAIYPPSRGLFRWLRHRLRRKR